MRRKRRKGRKWKIPFRRRPPRRPVQVRRKELRFAMNKKFDFEFRFLKNYLKFEKFEFRNGQLAFGNENTNLAIDETQF